MQSISQNPILKIEYKQKKFIIQKNIFPKNFQELIHIFEKKYNFEKIPIQKYQDLELYYLDSENDTITISNDEDLKHIFLNQNLLLSQKNTIQSYITITLQENNFIKQNKHQNQYYQQQQENQENSELEGQDSFIMVKETSEEFEKITLKKSSSDFCIISNIHHNVKCDICQIQSIEGIRYKCKQCINTNLCEVCFKKNAHPHSFEVIDDPVEYNKKQINIQQMKGLNNSKIVQNKKQNNFDIVFPFLQDKENYVKESLQDYSLADLKQIYDLQQQVQKIINKSYKKQVVFFKSSDTINQNLVICAQQFTILQGSSQKDIQDSCIDQIIAFNKLIQSKYEKNTIQLAQQLSEVIEIRPLKLYEFCKINKYKNLQELAEIYFNDPNILDTIPNEILQ